MSWNACPESKRLTTKEAQKIINEILARRGLYNAGLAYFKFHSGTEFVIDAELDIKTFLEIYEKALCFLPGDGSGFVNE